MKKSALLAGILSGSLLIACNLDEFVNGAKKLGSNEDTVVRGLRAALSVGIDTSAGFAGEVDGYLAHAALKILLPDDARQAVAAAEKVGAYVAPFAEELQGIKTAAQIAGVYQGSFADNLVRSAAVVDEAASLGHLGDSLVKYMNRAAERAAPRSVPIFKSAIASITITDGLSLLNSPDSTAATAYLSGKTFASLETAYAPLVDSTIALVPLTKYWGDFRSAYNALLADYRALEAFQSSWNGNAVVRNVPALQVDALDPVDFEPIETESLGAWTTEKALTGLFWLVGEQEKAIRRDPLGYVENLAGDVADLLKTVFGDIMDMGSQPGP